jgi:hypothetical protein
MPPRKKVYGLCAGKFDVGVSADRDSIVLDKMCPKRLLCHVAARSAMGRDYLGAELTICQRHSKRKNAIVDYSGKQLARNCHDEQSAMFLGIAAWLRRSVCRMTLELNEAIDHHGVETSDAARASGRLLICRSDNFQQAGRTD